MTVDPDLSISRLEMLRSGYQHEFLKRGGLVPPLFEVLCTTHREFISLRVDATHKL
jgi:hypothetical protein